MTTRIRVAMLCTLFAVGTQAGTHSKTPPKSRPVKAAPVTKRPAAGKASKEPVEAIEPIEEIDTAPADANGDATSFTTVIGHLHSAMVHMPIAWLMLLWLCDVGWLLFDRRELQMGGTYLSVLALLSFIPAVTTGLLRFEQLPHDATNAAPALLHRNIMFACLALCTAIVMIRLGRRHDLHGAWRWTYLGLVTAAFLTIALGGHIGGRLVFGDDFLPF